MGMPVEQTTGTPRDMFRFETCPEKIGGSIPKDPEIIDFDRDAKGFLFLGLERNPKWNQLHF